MRVFLACRVDAASSLALYDALAPLRADLAAQRDRQRFRWVAPKQYHLTLRFFGSVSAEVVGRIGALVEPIAAQQRRFACTAGVPVPLPSARFPNVVAVPIESSGHLEDLAIACNDALAAEFGAPDKPFRAHLTVIRCRRGARVGVLGDAPAIAFDIAGLGLYESTLLAGGARYRPLFEFAFAL